MATDAHDSRRKHRRSSSPEEVDRSSKRHRHRHHRHRHRHGSRKRDEESEYDGEAVARVPSPTPAPNSGPNRHLPEDDVEEGEILEEEGLGGRDGEVRKSLTESDAEPGEIEVTGDRDVRSDKANLGLLTGETLFHHEAAAPFREVAGINAKNSKTRSEDISSDKFISPAFDRQDGTYRRSHLGHGIHEDDDSPNYSSFDPKDGKDARTSTDGMGNEHLGPKSLKGDKRQNGELGCFKGNEKLKVDYDDEDLEINGGKVNYSRNSSSESGGEKYRMSGSSPSHDRYRSRSRSSGHTRDRSRSRSIVEEYAHSKRRHSGEQGFLSYTGRHKTDYDLDEERMMACRRERRHGSRDLVVDDRREHSTSYHSREAGDWDRRKDRDMDRDLRREKQRERSRNREVDWLSRRDKERERSHERDRRDVEKDRNREREDDRDRRREKKEIGAGRLCLRGIGEGRRKEIGVGTEQGALREIETGRVNGMIRIGKGIKCGRGRGRGEMIEIGTRIKTL